MNRLHNESEKGLTNRTEVFPMIFLEVQGVLDPTIDIVRITEWIRVDYMWCLLGLRPFTNLCFYCSRPPCWRKVKKKP